MHLTMSRCMSKPLNATSDRLKKHLPSSCIAKKDGKESSYSWKTMVRRENKFKTEYIGKLWMILKTALASLIRTSCFSCLQKLTQSQRALQWGDRSILDATNFHLSCLLQLRLNVSRMYHGFVLKQKKIFKTKALKCTPPTHLLGRVNFFGLNFLTTVLIL